MKLGFNMEGTEARFEHWLHTAFKTRDGFDFSYLEIGVALCQTLFAVTEWTKVAMGGRYNWFIHGRDILGSPFFDSSRFLRECLFPCSVSVGHEHSVAAGISVNLTPNVEPRVSQYLNFCLIDGCHGAPCVKHDFESIEQTMCPGGIVAFHDACLEDQGGESIQHCGKGITVREALLALDLLPESKRFRKGWNFLEEVHGDKTRNGNGFVFVQTL